MVLPVRALRTTGTRTTKRFETVILADAVSRKQIPLLSAKRLRARARICNIKHREIRRWLRGQFGPVECRARAVYTWRDRNGVSPLWVYPLDARSGVWRIGIRNATIERTCHETEFWPELEAMLAGAAELEAMLAGARDRAYTWSPLAFEAYFRAHGRASKGMRLSIHSIRGAR